MKFYILRKNFWLKGCEFWDYNITLHKRGCISAKSSSKLGCSALDLHSFCIKEAASRQKAQASLAVLHSICTLFANKRLHLGEREAVFNYE